MTRPKTCLVIGGGIVGLSSALALLQRGLMVTVRDEPRDLPPASWGNIGHIAIEQSEPLASLAMLRNIVPQLSMFGGPVSFPLNAIGVWLPFGLRLIQAASPRRFETGKSALAALLSQAVPAWRRLAAITHGGHLLKETGHIVVLEKPGRSSSDHAALAATSTTGVSCHDLGLAEQAQLGAHVRGPIVRALRYEGTASVSDPGGVLEWLRRFIQRSGGVIETGVAGSREIRSSAHDLVVVAAGVRSAALLVPLGFRVPLIAERGYHIQTASTDWPVDLPPVVFRDRALVVTRFTSGLRASSFVEFSTPDAPPDPRKWQRILRHTRELGLDFGENPARWFGSRPTLPDYLPAIGRSTGAPRLIYAFGHQHLGLTLGPITGELVASLAMGERPPVDLLPFAIERFA